MKKPILILAAVCAAACCLGACGGQGEDPEQLNEYAALNSMLRANYSEIVITVKNTFDDATVLNSEYTIEYAGNTATVHYEVERFSALSLDEAPENMKETLVGSAVVKGGTLTSVEGDDVGIKANIVEPLLHFEEEYFENAQLSDVLLVADVKDASAFLGASVDCTDMKVKATFLDVFFDITVTYTSASGSQVEFAYIFML